MKLHKYNVTVRRFDPRSPSDGADDFILPVDSPDAENAVSAAMSNAIAFTTKVIDDKAVPIAFMAIKVCERMLDEAVVPHGAEFGS